MCPEVHPGANVSALAVLGPLCICCHAIIHWVWTRLSLLGSELLSPWRLALSALSVPRSRKVKLNILKTNGCVSAQELSRVGTGPEAADPFLRPLSLQGLG